MKLQQYFALLVHCKPDEYLYIQSIKTSRLKNGVETRLVIFSRQSFLFSFFPYVFFH